MLVSASVIFLAPAALAGLAMVTFRTPAASSPVWSQQAQTAAFVKRDWRRPIAVNDLGLVAYRGGEPVLDLWGLANQDAREARLAANDTRWMQRIVDRSDVRLVAIYTDWFGEVPPTWTLVGHISRPPQVSNEETVDIYAVRPDDVAPICTALTKFATQKASPDTHVSCD